MRTRFEEVSASYNVTQLRWMILGSLRTMFEVKVIGVWDVLGHVLNKLCYDYYTHSIANLCYLLTPVNDALQRLGSSF